MTTVGSPKRNNRLLIKKMIEYLFPTMLTMAALSLNEFVDSMMVSNLLGSNAMAVVGLGSSITMCMSGVYTLLGNGGATLYALCIGKRETDKAGKIFRMAIITAMAVGLAFLAVGLICFNPIVKMLCSDAALTADFRSYLRVLLISAPFIITILTFVEFLPPSGAPKIASAVNIVANGVSLIMDYVYIKCFGMGVEGAAWATLTGYVAGTLLIAYVLLRRKANIHQSKVSWQDARLLGNIAALGCPSAVSQLGFALKFGFCNNLAMVYGGTAGVVAYSLCNQTLSVVSIFLASIVSAALPLIAVLHGQRDFRGENSLLKTTMRMQFAITLVLFVAFEIFTQQVAAMYSITGPDAALAIRAVRIFAIMYLFRGFYLTFMKYFQVLGRTKYSMFISVFDGFAGIIPIAFVLTGLMGMDGLWWAFVCTSALLLGAVWAWNRRIAARSNGRLKGWLLAARDDEALKVFDVTIYEDAQNISSASEALQHFCADCGIDAVSAMRAALAVEEMAIYTRNRLKNKDYMDVLARLYGDKIEIDFRSLGNSFNPLVAAEGDIAENIRMLQGIASTLEYDYIMGMNCTRMVIARKVVNAQ